MGHEAVSTLSKGEKRGLKVGHQSGTFPVWGKDTLMRCGPRSSAVAMTAWCLAIFGVYPMYATVVLPCALPLGSFWRGRTGGPIVDCKIVNVGEAEKAQINKDEAALLKELCWYRADFCLSGAARMGTP